MARFALASLASWLVLLVGCTAARESDGNSGEVPTRETPVVKHSGDGLFWTERAYPTGDRRTSVILLESGTPAEVNAGMRYEYVLRATNLTDQNLDHVVVTDKPEGNFRLQGSNPRAEDGKNLRWNLGNLSAKQMKQITVSGTALDEGHVVHCAEVDWRSLFCSTTQVVKPGLTISHTATAATLLCDPITYTVTIANSGTGTTRNVVVEDRLPAGVTTLEGKSSLQYTLPALEPGESKTLSWKAKAVRTGKFTSVASARADGNLTAKSTEVWTTVTRPALVIEMKGTKHTYMGRSITYDMTLRNTGDGEARDVIVTDSVPAGTKFVQASADGSLDRGAVHWRFGNMAPGATRTFSLKLSSGAAAKVRNTITASAYCADAVSAQADTDVTGIAAILLEVKDLEDPIEIGATTTYEIVVTNQGTTADTNIRIAVDLEATMEYVGTSGSTKVDQTGKNVVFRPLATLAPGEKAVWRVEVKAVGEGDVRINVAMRSDQLSRPVEESEATKFFR